jgi:putative two-component system response regulator
LILLDVMMPETDGYEVIRKLKSDPRRSSIPVMFLTSCTDEENELQGLSLGAADYILKPFSAPILRRRIENLITAEESKRALREFNEHLSEMLHKKAGTELYVQNRMLGILSDMVEFRDGHYTGHVTRTQKFMEILLDAMPEEGVYPEELAEIDKYECASAAKFHDIGKIFVCEAVLNKKGELTEEEKAVLKTHVSAGLQMIARLEEAAEDTAFLRHARQIVGGHHERWDGSGYPAGLKGTDIPLEGRLMAIADTYDELTAALPYKEPVSHEEARAVIESGSGSKFDPELIRVFRAAGGSFETAAKEDCV